MSERKEVGRHDFSGRCESIDFCEASLFATFSVGVFQWVPKMSGKGMKKSKVKVRVIGLAGQADAVYSRAREIAGQLDAGTYDGTKVVRVGTLSLVRGAAREMVESNTKDER
jgi:hypothetical protein